MGPELSTQIQLCPCRMSGCLIGENGCRSLFLALQSNPAHLKELDLSFNHPGDAVLDLLSAAVLDPRWKLETLKYSQTQKRSGEHFLSLSVTTSDLPLQERSLREVPADALSTTM